MQGDPDRMRKKKVLLGHMLTNAKCFVLDRTTLCTGVRHQATRKKLCRRGPGRAESKTEACSCGKRPTRCMHASAVIRLSLLWNLLGHVPQTSLTELWLLSTSDCSFHLIRKHFSSLKYTTIYYRLVGRKVRLI